METPFTEKLVHPAFNSPINVTPKQLEIIETAECSPAYDPAAFHRFLDTEPQEIEFIFGPPLFIMSPRIRVYRVEQIKKIRGYLSSFKPDGFDEAGEPQVEVTIKATPTE